MNLSHLLPPSDAQIVLKAGESIFKEGEPGDFMFRWMDSVPAPGGSEQSQKIEELQKENEELKAVIQSQKEQLAALNENLQLNA